MHPMDTVHFLGPWVAKATHRQIQCSQTAHAGSTFPVLSTSQSIYYLLYSLYLLCQLSISGGVPDSDHAEPADAIYYLLYLLYLLFIIFIMMKIHYR